MLIIFVGGCHWCTTSNIGCDDGVVNVYDSMYSSASSGTVKLIAILVFSPAKQLVIYIQRKLFFRRSVFLYSACPNLEGIKDALSYKFRGLTIGQNCCGVCTNEVAKA